MGEHRRTIVRRFAPSYPCVPPPCPAPVEVQLGPVYYRVPGTPSWLAAAVDDELDAARRMFLARWHPDWP